MEGYFPLKTKRKDVDDDFSDFSLSSPARKIRRLDTELPPIIEEDECDVPVAFEHPLHQEQRIKIEELPSLPSNEERAIVLFKPIGASPGISPSNLSVSVNPDIISGIKNQFLLSSLSNPWRVDHDVAVENDNSGSGTGCLAVVPWVPSELSSAPGAEACSQFDHSEMMDAQEVEETMEVDDDIDMEQRNVNESGGMNLNQGFNQWQQQPHCLLPQPPHNTTAPIVWYR